MIQIIAATAVFAFFRLFAADARAAADAPAGAQPGLPAMDRCVTADIGRQARKSARRDAFASGKRFDAACRPISAALRVAPAGPPAASKALTVAKATLRSLLLADRTPAGAMTRLSMVRRPG